MKKALFGVIALVLPLLGLVAVPATASAATCHASIEPLETAVQRSDAIVVGKVVALRKTARVVVHTTIKGSAGGTITLHLVNRTCGVRPLRKGTTYLFFLQRDREDWAEPNNLPTSSKEIHATVAKVRSILNPPPAEAPSVSFSDPLLSAPRPYWQVALPGFALIALAFVGLITLAATRRRVS